MALYLFAPRTRRRLCEIGSGFATVLTAYCSIDSSHVGRTQLRLPALTAPPYRDGGGARLAIRQCPAD